MQENKSSDPVEIFPIEIATEIFSYLKAKDLCTASLVSTAWYDLIAESQKCMKNIKINVKCNIKRSATTTMIPLIVNSTRRYENLELSRCHECVQDVNDLFFSKSKKWKRVKMSKTTFRDVSQALDVLACIESTVEVLELYDVVMMDDYSDRRRRGFTFPKMKVFRAIHIQIRLFHEAFDSVENLRHFELCSNGQTVASLKALVNIMTSNRKLKVWEVSCHVFNQLIYQNNVQFNFNLEKLSINAITENTPFFDKVKKNLAALLRSQSGSIQTLTLGHWMGMDVLEAALQLKNLKDFTMNGFSKDVYIDIDEHRNSKLATNNSLLTLSILNAPNEIEFLKKITSAVPKLTCFSIPLMDEPLMRHMSETHKELQCLSVGTFTASDASSQDLFKSLKYITLKSYKTNLARNINAKSPEKRSNFENLLSELFQTKL